jgi:plastocyanin
MPALSAVTLAVALIALSGCGGSSGTTSSTTAPATTAATSSTPASTSSSTAASTTSSSSSTGASTVPAGALTLEANREGQLSFSKTTLSAKAGKVSILYTNNSPLAHNLTIEAAGGKIVGATPTFQGGSKTLTVQLKAGTYKYFCSVPGHRQAGMEGTLTVS